jgi:putative hydrolase of the HAD superfamily
LPYTWIFDLDNTLHNADHGIFPSLDRAMTQYIMRELGLAEADAQVLRTHYYLRYGATMRGMHRHHGIPPDRFLLETHHIDELIPLMQWDRQVNTILAKLPGNKILLSNGPQNYIEHVTRRMAIQHHFRALYGVERVKYLPKPHRRPFLTVCAQQGLSPARCIMVEDSLDNLRMAKSLGMCTVWLSHAIRRPSWVDVRIRSVRELPAILGKLTI